MALVPLLESPNNLSHNGAKFFLIQPNTPELLSCWLTSLVSALPVFLDFLIFWSIPLILAKIINKESGWRVNARDGKYIGIPQTSASNLAKAGSDWRTNPITQLKAMKTYIKSRYGDAQNAWSHEISSNWYASGGLVTQAQLAHLAEQNKPEMILPLTNKSRTVQLAREALEMVAGNDVKASASTESTREIKTQNKELIKQNKTIISLLKSLVTASQNPVQS